MFQDGHCGHLEKLHLWRAALLCSSNCLKPARKEGRQVNWSDGCLWLMVFHIGWLSFCFLTIQLTRKERRQVNWLSF